MLSSSKFLLKGQGTLNWEKILSCCVGALLMLSAQLSMAVGDPFNVIRVSIDMEEQVKLLPKPNYEQVDILGSFKNAVDSIACGGTVSEGVDEDADDCLLMNQMTFTDGYMDTNGTVVTPNAATYSGFIGNFEVNGYVGDIVELTVNNKLPEAENGIALSTGYYAPENNLQSVHWHGMELDNESDGTPVSESGIPTGKSRLYRYRLYRPGHYWFHPHVLPLLTESRGMTGRLVVRDPAEDVLEALHVLPKIDWSVTLTDGTVASAENQMIFNLGEVLKHFTDEEVANNLMPNIAPDLDHDGACDRGDPGHDCISDEGELVFVNGVVPTSDANIPTLYVAHKHGARIGFINSSYERFYRFRLLLDGETPPSESAADPFTGLSGQCYDPNLDPPVKYSGQDPLSCDQGLPLYRSGGQNGLLDHVRLEGQPELGPGESRGFDTVIRTGEGAIGPSERIEFLVETKDRNGNYLPVGSEMFIWTVDYPHGIFQRRFDNNIGTGELRNRDKMARKLVRLVVVPNYFFYPPFSVDEGDPLMAHPAVNRPAEDLKNLTASPLAPVPAGNDPSGNPFDGSDYPGFKLDNRVAADNTRFPSLNNVRGHYEGANGIIGDALPTQGSTRYAHVGDVVEFFTANTTFAARHPWHMHGFSFQPISIHTFSTDANDPTLPIITGFEGEEVLHTYDYNEYVDVIQIPPNTAIKFRMKIQDRFKIPDKNFYTTQQLKTFFPYNKSAPYGGAGDIANPFAQMGGALGRWLFHCHILHHAGLGMIGDLCIAPQGAADASGCKIDIDENITFPTPPWL